MQEYPTLRSSDAAEQTVSADPQISIMRFLQVARRFGFTLQSSHNPEDTEKQARLLARFLMPDLTEGAHSQVIDNLMSHTQPDSFIEVSTLGRPQTGKT